MCLCAPSYSWCVKWSRTISVTSIKLKQDIAVGMEMEDGRDGTGEVDEGFRVGVMRVSVRIECDMGEQSVPRKTQSHRGVATHWSSNWGGNVHPCLRLFKTTIKTSGGNNKAYPPVGIFRYGRLCLSRATSESRTSAGESRLMCPAGPIKHFSLLAAGPEVTFRDTPKGRLSHERNETLCPHYLLWSRQLWITIN